MNKSIQRALQLGAYSLVLASTACKHDDVETPARTDEPGEVALPMTESNDNAASTGESLNRQVANAVADLAERTGIAADAITVTEARTVNWGSGAIGCPKDGMNYTQAIVPGVLLLLEADGKVYRYHGHTRGKPFHCPDERAEAPAYGPGQEFM